MFAPILNNLVLIAHVPALRRDRARARRPTTASSEHRPEAAARARHDRRACAAMARVNWPFVAPAAGRLRLLLDFRHPAVRKLARLSLWTLLYVGVNALGFGDLVLPGQRPVQGGPTAYVTGLRLLPAPDRDRRGVDHDRAGAQALGALRRRRRRRVPRRAWPAGCARSSLLLVPATAAYLVLAEPLIEDAARARRRRSARSAELVAAVLRLFAVGCCRSPPSCCSSRAFYARQDTRTHGAGEHPRRRRHRGARLRPLPAHGRARAWRSPTRSASWSARSSLACLLARRVGWLEARRTLDELAKVDRRRRSWPRTRCWPCSALGDALIGPGDAAGARPARARRAGRPGASSWSWRAGCGVEDLDAASAGCCPGADDAATR